ncbi:hypothetical protein MU582_16335 [Nocardioidaceae bacterium SCSIO 66511]|nr:hypothetical protein MU582_16335 [Nocardioidaceae bacterium SCSIO 66511]
MDIKIFKTTQCATSAGTAMSSDALGLRALVRDANPIAPAAVRVDGDFVGTTWSPPV